MRNQEWVCKSKFIKRTTQQWLSVNMYKMVVNISDEPRIFLFRGPGCRKKMLDWYYHYLDKAAESAEVNIKSIRVWGTIANRSDMVLEWVP